MHMMRAVHSKYVLGVRCIGYYVIYNRHLCSSTYLHTRVSHYREPMVIYGYTLQSPLQYLWCRSRTRAQGVAWLLVYSMEEDEIHKTWIKQG